MTKLKIIPTTMLFFWCEGSGGHEALPCSQHQSARQSAPSHDTSGGIGRLGTSNFESSSGHFGLFFPVFAAFLKLFCSNFQRAFPLKVGCSFQPKLISVSKSLCRPVKWESRHRPIYEYAWWHQLSKTGQGSAVTKWRMMCYNVYMPSLVNQYEEENPDPTK